MLPGNLHRPLRPGPVGGGDIPTVLCQYPAVGLELGRASGDLQPAQHLGTDGNQVVPRPVELDDLTVQAGFARRTGKAPPKSSD